MATNSLNLEEYDQFRNFFYDKTGIHFDSTKRYFVDRRLAERMEANDCERFGSYLNVLKGQRSGVELQALTNSMTVNETYFFREEYQLKCLVKWLLPDIVRRKPEGSLIRIWSIPSSSGEEPYSIAIYLTEHWAGLADWDVELISSDIDTDILQRARAGVFGPRSVHHLPQPILQKHFQRAGQGEFHISDDLRGAVEFTRVNIMDPAETRPYRDIDIVFCRNLLIYFDDGSRAKAAQHIYDAMSPGGFICLGHSESMSRITSLFKVRRFGDTIVYQKGDSR